MIRPCLLAALPMLWWSAPARATDATDSHSLPWHRRPYAAARVITGGYPDLYGASGSLYVPRPFALEAGLSRGVGERGSWYGRVGPALSLRERQTPGEVLGTPADPRYPTFDVLVQPMVGWRDLEDPAGDVPVSLAGPTFTTEVDVMLWVNAKTAADFQLSTGGSYWLERSDPGTLAFMPELRLAAGFAF